MNLFKNLNFDKLKNGLAKTKNKIVDKISETFTGKAKLDEEILEEIEEALISADIGFDETEKVIDKVRGVLKSDKDRGQENVIKTVRDVLVGTLNKHSVKENLVEKCVKHKPLVLLIVGVNGVGKTTTIGKLAYNFKNNGLNVMVGSADTFRAAANSQLEIWAGRAGVEIIQSKHGSDPSAVAYETIEKAIKNNVDVVMIDTAGRLHTKSHLMEELKKINRVIAKLIPDAPHETLLILDGATGQNGIIQAEEFSKVTAISGLIVTKLDGTAKGGIIFQICNKLSIPVRYIGVGEAMDDLQDFDPDLFVSAIFE